VTTLSLFLVFIPSPLIFCSELGLGLGRGEGEEIPFEGRANLELQTLMKEQLASTSKSQYSIQAYR
jgi:hypothetical protein